MVADTIFVESPPKAPLKIRLGCNIDLRALTSHGSRKIVTRINTPRHDHSFPAKFSAKYDEGFKSFRIVLKVTFKFLKFYKFQEFTTNKVAKFLFFKILNFLGVSDNF